MCVFLYVCAAARASVWSEAHLLTAAGPGMSHCVAVGTLPALLINIANLKVQKNVSF